MSQDISVITDRRRAARKKRKILPVAAIFHIKPAWEREIETRYVRFELDLEALSAEEMKSFFRVDNYEDFTILKEALGIPEDVFLDNGSKASGSLALATVLRRLAYPCRWSDCEGLLGRESSQLSRIYNATIDYIYDTKGYLVETFDLPWLTQARIEQYAEAIYEVSRGRYDNVWGFIDGTGRPICRPGELQREFYSGHSRRHLIKFQSIVTPDGIIINLFGPVLGSRHGCYMTGESDLLARLARKNTHWGKDYALFGDKGYALSPLVQMPFKGDHLTPEQAQFNLDMSRCRMAVENGFQKICTQFAFGNYAENNKLFWQQSAKSYLVSALLTNCLTCMYGFRLVERDYNVDPPSLKEYLCCEN